MRIIAGQWRSRRLAAVGAGDARAHLRPTADRVRESLFNLIAANYDTALPGARVLDLFAGTGALGLEALSRGAAEAVFVDTGRTAQGLIRENLRRLGTTAIIVSQDATKPLSYPGAPFDLVFLDPPYGQDLGGKALSAQAQHIAADALIVWEDNAPPVLPSGFTQVDQRRYGETVITLCHKDG